MLKPPTLREVLMLAVLVGITVVCVLTFLDLRNTRQEYVELQQASMHLSSEVRQLQDEKDQMQYQQTLAISVLELSSQKVHESSLEVDKLRKDAQRKDSMMRVAASALQQAAGIIAQDSSCATTAPDGSIHYNGCRTGLPDAPTDKQ